MSICDIPSRGSQFLREAIFRYYYEGAAFKLSFLIGLCQGERERGQALEFQHTARNLVAWRHIVSWMRQPGGCPAEEAVVVACTSCLGSADRCDAGKAAGEFNEERLGLLSSPGTNSCPTRLTIFFLHWTGSFISSHVTSNIHTSELEYSATRVRDAAYPLTCACVLSTGRLLLSPSLSMVSTRSCYAFLLFPCVVRPRLLADRLMASKETDSTASGTGLHVGTQELAEPGTRCSRCLHGRLRSCN